MSEVPSSTTGSPPQRGLTPEHFEVVLTDFVEENPLACEGLLGVCRLEYTRRVPTLAVTLRENPPRLCVNPDFLGEHILDEEDARAVLLHEFLHVLLGHTRLFARMDARTNLALDAVINHIVQRELGEEAGAFFRRFYTPRGSADPIWLLRPMAPGDILPDDPDVLGFYNPHVANRVVSTTQKPALRIHILRRNLDRGWVLADDVLGLFEEADIQCPPDAVFIGSHGGAREIHDVNRDRLEKLFRELNGSGIFRCPQDRGAGAIRASAIWEPAQDPFKPWRTAVMRILRRTLVDDPKGPAVETDEFSFLLPVATAGDRRAALRSLWNPILPDFSWIDRRPTPGGLSNVYLDVSGSMNLELQELVAVLWHLRDWIRRPFHAFSNGVVPATFENGRLVTESTGGTQFNDVLEHIVRTRPGRSLVITDGYIEPIDENLLRRIRANRDKIEVLVSGLGTTGPFDSASIPAERLPELPDSRLS